MFTPPLSQAGYQTQPSAQCVYHPDSQVTNFCRLQNCLMPLCPKCIQGHLEKHKRDGQHAELETVEEMRSITSQLIEKQLQNLNSALVKLNNFKDAKSDVHGQLHDQLIHSRQKVQRVIDAFFDQLMTELTQITQSNHNADVDATENSIMVKIQELQVEDEQLKSNRFLKHMVNLLGSNYLQKLSQHTIECEAFIEEVSKRTLDIVVDDTKLYNINLDLAKYVQLKNAEYYVADNTTLQNPKATKHPYLQKSDIYGTSGNKAASRINTVNLYNTLQFQINLPDYFEPLAINKGLHFWSDKSLFFYSLDLAQWKEIPLTQAIPQKACSLATPQGDIYLIGGILNGQPSNHVLKFDFQNRQLLAYDNLITARHSAAAVYLNQKFYVLGGQAQEDLTSVECFESNLVKTKAYNSNKQIIQKMQYGGQVSVCAFRTYIIKTSPLEIFDTRTSTWTTQNLNFQKVGLIQINNSNILVFGGQYGQLKKADSQTLQFTFEPLTGDPRLQQISNGSILHQSKVYALCGKQVVVGSPEGWIQ